MTRRHYRNVGDDEELEIVFSSLDGYVWASWPQTKAAVRLGRQHMVSDMMRDFLEQDAIGKRLTSGP